LRTALQHVNDFEIGSSVLRALRHSA
jgi:hypothetical protein